MQRLTLFEPSLTNTVDLLVADSLRRLSPLERLTDEENQLKRDAEDHYAEFIRQSWPIVEPYTPFKPNWHIDELAYHLEAVKSRQIRNLLITMPPRMMKSLSVSVFFCPWVWIDDPGERFLYFSYAQPLSTDHSVASRQVIESEWYQARWGDRYRMAKDQNLKTQFQNSRRGHRIAASVDGRATGLGGDILVCDDPHNVREAESDTQREAVLKWWDEAIPSRLNAPMTGVKIVVMQRVHEADLAGHLISQGGYTHLNLPMEYEPKTVHFTGFGRGDPRTYDGQLLAPNRVGPAEVAELKTRMGSRAYAGQYQQRPSPVEGSILLNEWWGSYTTAPLTFEWVTQAWDTAFKEGQENDYSVCLTTGYLNGMWYVLDVWRAKVIFPKLKMAVREQFDIWKPDEIIIEDKASGQSLIQELTTPPDPRQWIGPVSLALMPEIPFLPIVAFNPHDSDKVRRVHAISPYVESHRVLLKADAHWREAFVDECAKFPAAEHDDQVDALTSTILRAVSKEARVRPVSNTAMDYFSDLPMVG